MDEKRIETLKREYLDNGLKKLLKEKDWSYLKTFKENWDINSTDFITMVKDSLYAIKNFSGQGANSFSTINMIAQEYPDFIKEQFKNLFDETSGKSVTQRVTNFRSSFDNDNVKELLERKGAADIGRAYKNAQGNGAVVSYLWLMYPDKYYQYVPTKEAAAYQYLNPGLTLNGKNFDKKYNDIFKFMNEVKTVLYSDKDFKQKIQEALDTKGYDINNNKVINHIVYFASLLQKELTSATSSNSEVEDEMEEDNNEEDIPQLFKEFNFKNTLNIILYGPPGTGKTYNTKTLAVLMCDGKVDSSYEDICKRYKTLVDEERIQFITFHQSYSYEEFIGGLKATTEDGNIKYEFEDGVFKSFCDKNRNKKEKCVFIIDEINRGNIAKIFGELITLIETTKRENMIEATPAVLPYKKNEKFIVPANINIIGTMNTADRSITQLDTALRRRFDFIEMMPDYEFLDKDSENEDLNLKDLIQIMNERIEVLYDREHVIGHAYFKDLEDNFKIKDLTEIFTKKIIPLLKEYFYDDYNKIQLVLGEFDPTNNHNFILRVNNHKNLFASNIDLDDIEEFTYIVNNPKNITLDTYKMILNEPLENNEE